MLINTNTIITDDDLINFLLERYEETRNTMFLTAANSISLYRKDISFLNFCTTQSNTWVSVKDRLPKCKEEVLVYRGGHIGDLINVYTYIGNDDWEDERGWFSRTADEGITHWMPLPTPPTEKDN